MVDVVLLCVGVYYVFEGCELCIVGKCFMLNSYCFVVVDIWEDIIGLSVEFVYVVNWVIVEFVCFMRLILKVNVNVFDGVGEYRVGDISEGIGGEELRVVEVGGGGG